MASTVYWRITLAACCIFLSSSGSAPARTLRSWVSYGWNVGSYTNDRSGEFSHCAAGISYKSGVYLVFSVNRHSGWSMGFANPQWKLTPGANYQIRYTIDDRIPATAQANAISNEMVEVILPANTRMFELFRKGRILRVEGSGQNFFFQLDNTSTVLKEILDCATAHMSTPNVTATRNPFEQGPQPASNPKGGQSTVVKFRTEATAVLANVLASSGIQGFKLIEELKPEAAVHAVWTAPGLFGGLKILDGDDPESVSTMVIASDAQECKENFLSGRLPTSEPGVVSAKTACSDGRSKSTVIEYTIVRRPKGGSYLFSVVGADTAALESVGKANSAIQEAAIKGTR